MFEYKILVDYGPLADAIPQDSVYAKIYSDATGLNGFPYFWAVEKGRRGMEAPTQAGFKSLRWIGAPGTISAFSSERFANSVFAKKVGPTLPQDIRRKVLLESMPAIQALQGSYNVNRPSLVELVNKVAVILTESLARNTPRRTGALASSYRIEPAE